MTRLRKYGAALLLPCITAISFLFSLAPLNRHLHVSAVHAEEKEPEPIPVRIQYLFGFDGGPSGTPFGWINQIVVDDGGEELYLLDSDNKRVVITNTDGIFLYQFKFADAGIKFPRYMAVDFQKGDIYAAEDKRVIVLSYRGMFKHEIDLSAIPEKDTLEIQSIAFVRAKSGDRIYLGDAGKRRVLVISPDGKLVQQFDKKDGVGNSAKGIHVDERGITFFDPAASKVLHFSMEGKLLHKFGKVSSLLGGFSQPVDMAVNEQWILVVDNNRGMVIAFDRNGAPLFEFGGPNMFLWPRAVAVTKKGRIYVADNTGIIRVFEVREEAPVVIAAQPPPPVEKPAPPPVVEKPKDEVTKMVEEEKRLLPVFFAVNSARLDKQDIKILHKDAAWLKKNPEVKINVRGYADERGTDEYNLNLSTKRAKVVMDYLVKRGVDPKRLKFIGYGREFTTEKTDEGLSRSRRVDFLVVE